MPHEATASLELTVQAAQPASGFVQASGTGLVLDGAPFRFVGLNYFKAVGDPNLLSNLQETGMAWNVMRCWCFQAACVSGGAIDFAPIDAMIAVAKQLGIHLVCTLVDQWGYLDNGGTTLDLAWYQGGFQTALLSADIVPYLDWVQQFAARYADESSIAVVELVNECNADNGGGTVSTDALESFLATAGAAFRAADPNHLLCLGIQDDSSGDYGTQYQQINASALVGIGTQHDYGYPTDPMGNPTAPNVVTAIQMMQALGKPFFVGETGIDPSTITPATTAERATLLVAKIDAMIAAGAAGVIVWQWTPNCSGDTYKICPGDPVLGMLTVPAA